MFGELVADLTQRFALRPLPAMQAGIGLYGLWMGLAVQGDVEGAMPRDEMLVGFFRAMAGLMRGNRVGFAMSVAATGRRRIGCDATGTPLAGEVDGQRRFHRLPGWGRRHRRTRPCEQCSLGDLDSGCVGRALAAGRAAAILTSMWRW
jgi:hypothetical protein